MMLQIQSGFVQSNKIKLHYYRTGKGEKPPVVLAHGITDDGLCWTPVAEKLSETFDVIMVDARGHGKSEAPEDGYLLENLALDLAGVVQVLELRKPVIWGHSLGAIAALLAAGIFPEVPRAIVLEDPPPFWMAADGGADNDDSSLELIQWIASNKRKTWEDLQTEALSQNPGWSEAERLPWIDAKHRYSGKISALAHSVDVDSIDYAKIFSQITCPALLIHADPSLGAIVGETEIAKIREWVPHLLAEYIPHAGHSIRRDQFARCMDVVREFMATLP